MQQTSGSPWVCPPPPLSSDWLPYAHTLLTSSSVGLQTQPEQTLTTTGGGGGCVSIEVLDRNTVRVRYLFAGVIATGAVNQQASIKRGLSMLRIVLTCIFLQRVARRRAGRCGERLLETLQVSSLPLHPASSWGVRSGVLQVGAVVGEASVILNSAYPATVRAVTHVEIMALSKESVHELNRETLQLIQEKAFFYTACSRVPALRTREEVLAIQQRTAHVK